MRIIALLPARLNSKRIHQKLLKKINKVPIILHTAYRTKLCKLIDEVIVCTDSKKIGNLIKKNNLKVIYTKKNLANGTERISSIIHKVKADLVIDVHSDEAILNPNNIEDLINFHKKNKQFDIVVPHKKSDNSRDHNVVKIIYSKNNKILYFTRSQAPFPFRKNKNYYFHHLDYISFKPSALRKFKKFKMSSLEEIEGIELLRALENGMSIGTFEIKTNTFSINTKKDLLLAQKKFKKDKFFKKYFEKISI